ncbi:cation:proton antiporter regulatory subunit [Paeniglutamicibacter cryotolerans]|uniref:TrkA domain protein n=1 Tax=Paeniglutamicibacter cryotolerans TaxID=670079 RepID=A0A839QJU7_9MICC|nr:cation:proton antiporter regulatory subunit [Paeniglutamicibacter cryotolerans]MBB2994306.1 TrkA domain protein [Paeniglutamicibacter cryotolerans]
MNFEDTPLPGIGVRREITLATGRRVGVVMLRDGDMELIISRREDPDACAAAIPLNSEEAAALGAMLGAPQLVAHLTDQHSELPGVNTQQFVISADSPYVEQTLGDTKLRTRTGVSVVAIARGGRVVPSPKPDFELGLGDVLIIVGTTSGLENAAHIIHDG